MERFEQELAELTASIGPKIAGQRREISEQAKQTALRLLAERPEETHAALKDLGVHKYVGRWQTDFGAQALEVAGVGSSQIDVSDEQQTGLQQLLDTVVGPEHCDEVCRGGIIEAGSEPGTVVIHVSSTNNDILQQEQLSDHGLQTVLGKQVRAADLLETSLEASEVTFFVHDLPDGTPLQFHLKRLENGSRAFLVGVGPNVAACRALAQGISTRANDVFDGKVPQPFAFAV